MTIAVAHVMTGKVVFASMSHTVGEVRELMAKKRVHALPVVNKNKKVMGILSTADVARSMDKDEPARHFMTDIVVTIDATEPAAKAAHLMRKNRIHHLIVADKGKAVGIVSSLDLLKLVESPTPQSDGT